MKTKHVNKKLVLKKSTIANLRFDGMKGIQGGLTTTRLTCEFTECCKPTAWTCPLTTEPPECY